MFFMLFPITPSERVAERLGRESVFRSTGDNAVVAEASTSPEEEPMAAFEQTVTTTAVPRVTTTHTNYTITITSGSGFLYTDGYIPTGIYPYESTTTTVPADYPEEPEDTTDDPQLTTDDPALIDPTGSEIVEPTGSEIIEPGTEPAVIPDPVVTEPPVADPPPDEVSVW